MFTLFYYLFITLWRLWFYFLVLIYIIIWFPILLICTSREEWYPYFFKIARLWAAFVLYGSGLIPKLKKLAPVDPKKSYMIIANHTSLTDIFLMLYCIKNPFVFVGKRELTKFPIFGFFYKRTCILVDRGDQKSRTAVFEHAQRRIKQGNSICIFPEGGVPDDESIVLDVFKDGAFRLAIEHQLPILPLVFLDNKKRFSYTFFSGGPGVLRAFIYPEVPVSGLEIKDKKELKDRMHAFIKEEIVTKA